MAAPLDAEMLAGALEIIASNPKPNLLFGAPALSLAHLARSLNRPPSDLPAARLCSLLESASLTLFDPPRCPVVQSLTRAGQAEDWLVFLPRPEADSRPRPVPSVTRQSSSLPVPMPAVKQPGSRPAVRGPVAEAKHEAAPGPSGRSESLAKASRPRRSPPPPIPLRSNSPPPLRLPRRPIRPRPTLHVEIDPARRSLSIPSELSPVKPELLAQARHAPNPEAKEDPFTPSDVLDLYSFDSPAPAQLASSSPRLSVHVHSQEELLDIQGYPNPISATVSPGVLAISAASEDSYDSSTSSTAPSRASSPSNSPAISEPEPTPFLEKAFEDLPFGPVDPTTKVLEWASERWSVLGAEMVGLFMLAYVLQATGV